MNSVNVFINRIIKLLHELSPLCDLCIIFKIIIHLFMLKENMIDNLFGAFFFTLFLMLTKMRKFEYIIFLINKQ